MTPLFPLDVALLPGGELLLHIFEPRYRKMIARCMREPSGFGIVRANEQVLAGIGCEAVVVKVLRRYPDGRLDIRVRGTERIRIGAVREHEDGYIEAETATIDEGPEETDHTIEDRLEERYRVYASLADDVPSEPPPRGPRWSFSLAERLRLTMPARQELLETMSENARLRRLEELLAQLIADQKMREHVQGIVRGNGRLHAHPPGGGE
jgi:ATP-dependent Lon protease